jgi:chromosome segregation ATPase
MENQEALKLQSEQLDVSLKEAVKAREILSSMLADNNQIREKLEKNIEELRQMLNDPKYAKEQQLVAMEIEKRTPCCEVCGKKAPIKADIPDQLICYDCANKLFTSYIKVEWTKSL